MSVQLTVNRWFICACVAALAAGWATAIALGPWLAHLSDAGGAVLYAAASLVCHQRPERSFHLGPAQLPVCARCPGLYAGAALGVLGWTVASRGRPGRWARSSATGALLVSGAPTAVTVAMAWIGLGEPANQWRAMLAVPLGLVAGLVVGAVTTDHLK